MWASGVLPTRARFRLVLAALVLTAALVAMMAGPRPASAHDDCVGVYYGGVQRAVACVRDSHRWLDGCDRYSDGLRARAWYAFTYQGPGDWDPNGAASGCARAGAGSAFPHPGPGDWARNGAASGCAHNCFRAGILAFRICVEQPVGCSEWKGA